MDLNSITKINIIEVLNSSQKEKNHRGILTPRPGFANRKFELLLANVLFYFVCLSHEVVLH
jgi:hypothetical protein